MRSLPYRQKQLQLESFSSSNFNHISFCTSNGIVANSAASLANHRLDAHISPCIE